METRRVVTLLSGGLDSHVLAHHIAETWSEDVWEADQHFLFFDYGQSHLHFERVAAEAQAREWKDPPQLRGAVIDRGIFQSSALLGNAPIPEGMPEEDYMKSTVVPNRNAVFLALAFSYAARIGAICVATAIHDGGHGFPDNSKEFFTAFQVMQNASLGLAHTIQLYRPFIDWSKTEVVEEGHRLGVSMSQSYSCYNGREIQCGRCGTCSDRKRAFDEAGLVDHTEYED